ncbi:hypothetical protein MHK_009688 [Candidatus Magnetomorum sp. HK-1]|nr:hypothetical protein MHK_009688 [Candidatus Magnetomorum sp. HK-1]
MFKKIKLKYKKNIEAYNKDLQKFELQYGMRSSVSYEKFENGQLGDDMDYFEWAGLIELRDSLERR